MDGSRASDGPAPARPFLTAAWRNLLILNYEVDPGLLAPHLPAGVELDVFEGRNFISVVGFRFLDTRVHGLAIPGHRDFDEVNLRFYVVRALPGGERRRGVVFLRELVPRRAIALAARWLYGEPYLVVPIGHVVVPDGSSPSVSYSFRLAQRWCTLAGRPEGDRVLATDDSAAAFITEHYWGYTRRSPLRTSEYEVRHPVWKVRPVPDARFDGDATPLYGARFAAILSAPPASALLADGSEVAVCPATMSAHSDRTP